MNEETDSLSRFPSLHTTWSVFHWNNKEPERKQSDCWTDDCVLVLFKNEFNLRITRVSCVTLNAVCLFKPSNLSFIKPQYIYNVWKTCGRANISCPRGFGHGVSENMRHF